MTVFLADAPANVEACEVAGGQGTHGHAKVGKRLVHGFDARAFFDQELGFAPVWSKHAIADEASAVADQHAHFAELFRKLHAGGDNFLAE